METGSERADLVAEPRSRTPEPSAPVRRTTFRTTAPRIAAEFVIIVVGVLVALAADSWMSEREAARRSETAVRLLIAELERDSLALARLVRPLPLKDSVTARFLAARPESAIPEDTAIDWLRVFWLSPSYAASRAAFESVLEADGLRYIGEPDLQLRLLRYYEEEQARLMYWFNLQYQRLERYTDLFSKHIELAPAGYEEARAGIFGYPMGLRYGWRGLRNDAELALEIAALNIFERQMLRVVESVLASNAALRQELARQLGGTE